MRKWLLVGILVAAASTVALGDQTLFQFKDDAQEERFRSLTSELRCLVCQNESLADSQASLADDLRREVYEKMQAGASNKEIVTFLVARYGDFVLYRPRVKPVTYLLWFGPAAFVVLGLGILLYTVRRRARKPEAALTEEERRRLQQVLGGAEEKGGP
jgi:cytochrome c-type biogenesis protein CcmH